ncbi:alpha/beta fold hydrolase [Haloferax namakaokahaiae]|uniref:Alpha/beta fold hydrolase n=1 Tax=Haloferax namakaokahaiae TaxID=1748331 RepID=A0ABD5ZFH9_9EURY
METVTSSDGTPIAYERTGSGPPLVLVHATTSDHTRWELADVRPTLAQYFTVYAMDRRGYGESGDAERYSLEREFDDVVAVVDSIDEPVNLLGHSQGALCALGASLRTANLSTLILYEAPTPWGVVGPYLYAEDLLAEMEALIAAGDVEQALVLYLAEYVELKPEELESLREAPSWPDRVEMARIIPREERAPAEFEFDSTQFAEMTTPTLLLVGGESFEWADEAAKILADALPNSRVVTFEGQGHVAMNTVPGIFVDTVVSFVQESSGAVFDERADHR